MGASYYALVCTNPYPDKHGDVVMGQIGSG